jgi:hypothetical protein
VARGIASFKKTSTVLTVGDLAVAVVRTGLIVILFLSLLEARPTRGVQVEPPEQPAAPRTVPSIMAPGWQSSARAAIFAPAGVLLGVAHLVK